MPPKTKDKGRKVVAKKANALKTLQVTYLPVGEVKPNSYNPNRQDPHDFELLLRSMREDGFTQPIVVQTATREIVDGEHRWRAAQELGMTEIPVVLVDMTAEQMRIATLRHNRARGNEDLDLTAALLRDLQELGAIEWAQDSLMLDDAELNAMLEDLNAPEAMMSEEFSGAWEPIKEDSTGLQVDPQHQMSMTQGASDTIRRREEMLKAAKTEEERQAAKRDGAVHRVVAVFAGNEAVIVRDVLGAKPAERILEFCTKAWAGHQAEASLEANE